MKTAAIASGALAMTPLPKYSAIPVVFSVFSLGCGQSATTPPTDAAADVAVDRAPPTPQCDPTAEAVDLNGTWAVRATLGVELRARAGAFVRLCPDPQVTTASLLIRMALTTTGTRVSHQVQVCQITLPRARGAVGDCPATPLSIELTSSPSLSALLPRFPIPEIGAEMPSTRPCSAYRPDGFNVLLGVRESSLTNPMTDPLPSWCSPCMGTTAETCVCRDCASTGAMCMSRASEADDTDGDMNPGVTVGLTTGEGSNTLRGDAFLVFRTRPQLDGRIIDANRLSGSLSATLDYSLVGSRVTVLGGALETAGVVAALPDFRFIAEESAFVMLRADGAMRASWDADSDGQISCADITARANNFNR